MTEQNIRLTLLKRLAEQAMSDQAFRDVAKVSLDDALVRYGYDLNEAEQALVRRFRDSLAEAGVDLSLASELSLDLDDDLNMDDVARLESALRAAAGS
jgi:hypothetical protein